jgi:hypothetical protein
MAAVEKGNPTRERGIETPCFCGAGYQDYLRFVPRLRCGLPDIVFCYRLLTLNDVVSDISGDVGESEVATGIAIG